jgi:hypothetical protein
MRCWPVAIALLFVASCGGSFVVGDGTGFVSPAVTLPANAWTASLNGLSETPSAASTVNGTTVAIIDPATRLLRAAVVMTGIAARAVRIHEASPGTVGPAIFAFTETSAGSGIWTAQVTLTDTQVNALTAGNYYVNVESALFPTREIRGQLVQQLQASADNSSPNSATLISILTRTDKVPPTSSTTTAVGAGVVDMVGKTLTAAITTLGIAGTDASIHESAPSTNGPVIIQLAQTSAASGIWVVKVGLSDAQIMSILTGNDYFEVQSTAFPRGEVRGQIMRQDTSRFGFEDCRFRRFDPFGCNDSGFSGIGFGFAFGAI